MKLCVDCKWCRVPDEPGTAALKLRQKFAKCHHPKRITPAVINKVTGETDKRLSNNYCSYERARDPGIFDIIFNWDWRCGARGRLWEKKDVQD